MKRSSYPSAKRKIRALCENYGIQVGFKTHKSWMKLGQIDTRSDKIFISQVHNQTMREILSTTCHEICHLFNRRAGKYPIYHNIQNWKKPSMMGKLFATAYRAELFTDREGKKLLKKHYPQIKYLAGYTGTPLNRKYYIDKMTKKD
jgi:hypothetical protein